MPTEPLSPNVCQRICKHMTNDHHEALIKYAISYGGFIQPSQAQMIDLTPTAMQLEVDGKTVIIPFDHILTDSEDAHRTLVSMAQGRSVSTYKA